MRYENVFTVRLTQKQMNLLSKLTRQSSMNRADVIRRALEIAGSEDHVVVPLSEKERLLIEGICEVAGVQPPDAVKLVLLSYHTLMSSPLWKIVRPVTEILDEMKVEKNEREGAGESSGES